MRQTTPRPELLACRAAPAARVTAPTRPAAMVRRTKEDALATRSALLDAAECVFQQRGVAGTSLGDIARAAGLTRGAIYWHFKDKAELFNAMMERVTLPLESDLAGLADAPGDPIAQLRRRVRRTVRQIARDERTRRVLEIATLMVEYVDDLGPVRERHVRSHRANVALLAQALARAAALRRQRLPAPAVQLAEGLHAITHGLVHGWLVDPSFNLERTLAAAFDAYLAGIGLPPRAAPDRGAPDQG